MRTRYHPDKRPAMPCKKNEQRKKYIEEWKYIAAIYHDGRKPTYHETLLKE
jgi:hypothetical protein